ncbi:MAG: restriction endonuclease subunit S [Desulfatiglans sp.]|nr:restriction endonuclease subunit S [Desulfatiglans sp.]
MSEPLRELANIEYGASPKEIRVGVKTEIKIFGTGGLMGYSCKPLFEQPLVVVARKGTLDRPIYSDQPCWVIDTAFAVIPKKNVNAKWLFYQLSNYDLKRLNEATGVPSISRDFLYRIKFKRPTLQAQRKIAHILSNVDVVIEKTQAAIAKYKAIKQGMLHDLFTRGIDPATNKLRPVYIDAPHLYKESKLGWIPNEWVEVSLAFFTTQIGDGIHTTPKYSENTDYYFVNGNNLSEGEILIGDTALCVSKEEYEKHFIGLDKKTILYSINGTIGNIAFYKDEKIILGKSACYITCKNNVNLDFIYFFLQSFRVKKYYENELTGSTIKNLSLASIRNTPITIPKDDGEQEFIANRIRAIDRKLQTEQIYLHKMQQIKAGLMADLLSGKKEVRVEAESIN